MLCLCSFGIIGKAVRSRTTIAARSGQRWNDFKPNPVPSPQVALFARPMVVKGLPEVDNIGSTLLFLEAEPALVG